MADYNYQMSFFTRCSGALTFKLLVAYSIFILTVVSSLSLISSNSKANLDIFLFTIVCLSLNLYLPGLAF